MKIVVSMLLIACVFLVGFMTLPVSGPLPITGSTQQKVSEPTLDPTNTSIILEKSYPFGTPLPVVKGQDQLTSFDPKEPVNSRIIEDSKKNNLEK